MSTPAGSYKSIVRALDTLDALGENSVELSELFFAISNIDSCFECDTEDHAIQDVPMKRRLSYNDAEYEIEG